MNVKIVSYKSVEYYQALALRDLVLRAPLGLIFSTEDIQSEENYFHFVIEMEDKIIATAQFLCVDEKTYKMRQVAVLPEFQGTGYGSKLVAFIEEWAVEKSIDKIILHARESACPFYFKRNYHKVGAEFIEVGIPHYFMEKRISS